MLKHKNDLLSKQTKNTLKGSISADKPSRSLLDKGHELINPIGHELIKNADLAQVNSLSRWNMDLVILTTNLIFRYEKIILETDFDKIETCTMNEVERELIKICKQDKELLIEQQSGLHLNEAEKELLMMCEGNENGYDMKSICFEEAKKEIKLIDTISDSSNDTKTPSLRYRGN